MYKLNKQLYRLVYMIKYLGYNYKIISDNLKVKLKLYYVRSSICFLGNTALSSFLDLENMLFSFEFNDFLSFVHGASTNTCSRFIFISNKI